MVIFLHIFLVYFKLFVNETLCLNFSTFGNPDIFGCYIAILLPFCFEKSKYKKFRKIVIVLSIFLLFIIQARTSLLSLFFCFLLYLFINNKLNNKLKCFFRFL